jgi:hypothetical protein
VASIAYDLRAISDKESAEEAQTAFEATIRQWCDLVCKDSGNRSGTLGEVFASHIHPYISSPAWLKLLEEHGNKRGKSSKYLAARDELLAPVFEIFTRNVEARANLAKLASNELTQSWQAGDVAIQRALRETRQLIRPSRIYLKGAREEVAGVRSHVGGLSQRRLATLTAYKDLLQAFDRRPSTEEKYRGFAERFESFGVGAGKGVRKQIVTLREEYAQVMASRIIEAALGLGGEPGKAAANKHNGAQGKRDLPRKDTFERSESNGQTPVIVMENLANYAPVQTQGRRENAQLQRWLSQRVTQLVQQSAQEHGLRVELVSPHRVSQRDAYTFGAGVRVAQVSVADFVREAGVHAKQIERALEKIESGAATKFDQYLVDLVAKWDPTTRTWQDASGRTWTLRGSAWSSTGMQSGSAPQAVLVPDPTGDLFVSENAELSGRLYRNAEINAASNVALRPLCDPEYPGTWSVVPIDATTGRPLDSMKGTAYEPEQQLVEPVTSREERAKTSKRVKASRGAIPRPKKNVSGSNVRNAYRNPMNGEDSWQPHAEREAAIKAQVVNTLRTIHGLRVD